MARRRTAPIAMPAMAPADSLDPDLTGLPENVLSWGGVIDTMLVFPTESVGWIAWWTEKVLRS